MWRTNVEPWSTIAGTAVGIGYLMIMLIAVPIAGLIFIARAYLSLAQFIAAPTEGQRRTGDIMDEDVRS